jgi:hypothetical protein
MKVDVAIPDFTSLAKRAEKLGIDIDVTKYRSKIDMMVGRSIGHGGSCT